MKNRHRALSWPVLLLSLALCLCMLKQNQAAAQMPLSDTGALLADSPKAIPFEELITAIRAIGADQIGGFWEILREKTPAELWPVVWNESAELLPPVEVRFWEWGIRLVSKDVVFEQGAAALTLHIYLITREIPSTNCYYPHDVLFIALSDQYGAFEKSPVYAGALTAHVLENGHRQLYYRVDGDVADGDAKVSVNNAMRTPTPIGELWLGFEVDKAIPQHRHTLYEFGILELPVRPTW